MSTEIGQPAPEFTAPSHKGDSVTLSEFQGNQNVLLSFHIFSFTGG